MSEKNKGIFYGVVAIATLIVAIVGATLAYFSVFASSPNNAVGFRAAVISISYNDGTKLETDALIPATEAVVTKSYLEPIEPDLNGENGRPRCTDDNKKQICHLYNFSITNSGEAVDLSMNLKIGVNEFNNLRYMLYDITDYDSSQPLQCDKQEANYNCPNNIYDTEAQLASNTEKSYWIQHSDLEKSISGYDTNNNPTTYAMPAGTSDNPTTREFDLVIFLNETSPDLTGLSQDDEQNAQFAGTIEIKFGEGTTDKITGRISGVND